MILKVIGGILILAACALMGIAAANKYSQRPKDIKKLRSSIQMLETEIIFGCTPLPQALNNISQKVDGPLKCFYSTVAEDLLAGFSYSLEKAWSKGLERLIKDTSLASADQELLSDFSKVLGSSDREDQKKHFELFYIQLRQNEEMAEELRRKNEKMYRSLGILSGIVIFVILV